MLLSSLPAVYSRWLSASAPLPALFSRWLFAIVPLPADTQQRRPGWSAAPLQRPGQLLRCNTSVSTSAVAPWPVNFSAAALRPAAPPQRLSRPATNLIRQRKVLRFGYQSGAPGPDLLTRSCCVRPFKASIYIHAPIPIAATLEVLLRQTQICRPICTDCLRHLRISAE